MNAALGKSKASRYAVICIKISITTVAKSANEFSTIDRIEVVEDTL
jgi:hypothetical protein